MIKASDVASVGFSLIEHGMGNNYEGFDYTKLSAINQCPTWGIIRYGIHKTMARRDGGGTRSTALEAGKAAHDAFASVRVAQLWYTHPDHATFHAHRIFGKDRSASLLAVIRNAANREQALRAVSMEAISTSGFQDDPFDKRRTLANLETSVVAYADSYDSDRWPVWIEDASRPEGKAGIEQPFAMLVTILLHDGRNYEIKYTGKIDGLHWHREEGGEIILHENKTGGRLDEAWSNSFSLSHQVTGYIVAGSLFTGSPIGRAVVRGVQLPMPRMLVNGLQDVWVYREQHHISRWAEWLIHTHGLYTIYRDDPLNAPKYTHSCNRYYRPCPFIPLCYAGDEEQKAVYTDEMVKDEWNPLAEEYDG